MYSAGAELFHVLQHTLEYRNGTQTAHNAANSQRVSDGLSQAVLLGYIKVDDGTGLVSTDLKHADDVIGISKSPAALQGSFYLRVNRQTFGHLMRNYF